MQGGGHTYTLTHTYLVDIQGSGISSHSFGRSSAAAMFPFFITHDEYFVRSGGSGGGSTIFLICPATNFLVDKNSLKYGLHTNIVPQQEGYEGTN